MSDLAWVTQSQVQDLGLIKSASFTLINAQIKALAATEVQVVAGVSGKMISTIQAIFILDATAGAYGNLNDLNPFYLKVTGLSAPLTTNANVFPDDDSGISTARVYPYWNLDGSDRPYAPGLYKTQVSGVGISVKSSNSGELNGGNDANTMKVIVYYTLVDLS